MKKLLSIVLFIFLFSNAANAVTQTVTVQNFFFMPFSVTINLGDTIKFQRVNGSHDATSTSIPVGATAFNPNINSSTPTFIYVPTVPGVYNYICSLHTANSMVGSFTVVCPAFNVSVSAASATTFCKPATVVLNSTVTGNALTYQWKKGSGIITGANSPSYTAKNSGTYRLQVTNACGVTALSNAIVVTANPSAVANITPSGTVTMCAGSTQLLQANTGIGLSYVWYRKGVVIAGATSSSYTANKAGTYKVTVTVNSTGCSKTSAVTKIEVNCRTNEADYLSEDATVYPNPSQNDFTISLPEFSDDIFYLDLTDITGKLILSERVDQQEFVFGNDLSPGMYLVSIRDQDQVVSRSKIIKE